MDTCTFSNFIAALRPWLNRDYIRQAHIDESGKFVLMFTDGGQKTYRVDDCTAAQVKDAVSLLEKNGVPVSK